jgi:hypothetical protein
MSSSPFATDAQLSEWRELASRETDGLAVALLWNPATDHLVVTVADSRLEQEFELHPAPADAMAAFNHPFALAAAEGLAFDVAGRATSDLQPQV